MAWFVGKNARDYVKMKRAGARGVVARWTLFGMERKPTLSSFVLGLGFRLAMFQLMVEDNQ